jgi:hypothetical protein
LSNLIDLDKERQKRKKKTFLSIYQDEKERRLEEGFWWWATAWVSVLSFAALFVILVMIILYGSTKF